MNSQTVGCFIVALAAFAAAGVERVWVGPDAGGLWNEPTNWEPQGAMTADDVAVFRPTGSLSLTVKYTGSYLYAQGFRFESGSTFIGHDLAVTEDDYLGHIRLTGAATEGAVFTNELYVAAGATCVFSNACLAGVAKRAAIRRTGGGTLTVRGAKWGNDWGKLSGWDFAAGTTVLDCNGTSQINVPVLIRAGAVLKSPRDYAFHASESPFAIEAGGVLDLEGADFVYLTGVRGAGVITNASTISDLSLADGPYRFAGHIYPTATRDSVTLSFRARAESQADAEWKMLLADADAFSQVRVEFPNCDGAPLGFASGVSTFNVKRIQGDDKSMLTLEDEDGAPVSLFADFVNPAKFRLKGRGAYYNVTKERQVAGSFVDVSNLTGTLGATAEALVIGDGTEVNWPQTDERLVFANRANGAIHFRVPTAGSTVLTNRLTGTGPYAFWGCLTLLNACTDGSWWQVRENADVTVAGGDAVVGGYGLYLYAGSTLTVTDDAVLRGASAVPSYGFAGNVLKQTGGLPAINQYGNTDSRLVVEKGGRLCTAGPTRDFTVRDGGILELFGAPDGTTGTWLFDGGQLHLNPAILGFTFMATPVADAVRLLVGPKGLTIRALPQTSVYSDGSMQFVFLRPFAASDDETGAGGITRLGGGFCDFWQPLTIRGTFANLDGTLRLPNQAAITEATAPLFGTGDFRLGNARLEYGSEITTPFVARLGTGGQFLYDGAATVRVRESASRPVQTLALGELTRGSAGAALYFWDNAAGQTYNQSGTKVTFMSAPATTADGRIQEPVFTYANGRFDFARYTAADGLTAFEAYADWAVADETKTVRTPTSVTHVTADTAVGALRLDGINGVHGSSSPLVIDAGATLTVGCGAAPACLILNGGEGWAPATIRGAGTLSFGGREGVIVANDRVATSLGDEFAAIHARIADADGLTITRAATLGAEQGVALCGDNAYAGTTRVFGTRVMPRAAGAFGSSVVEIGAGELQGGTLRIDVEGLTVPNVIRAAGWGARAAADAEGAITFAKSATLAGPVEASDEMRVVACAGARGVFAGEVSGAKVWVWKGAGEVCFAAANVCTGGVEVVGSTLVLTDVGTAGTGDIRLNGGTLVLENAADKTLPNRIYGKGTIRLAGKGTAHLPALESEDGVGFALDLAEKVATIGSLKEISAITTARKRPTALIVADGDLASFEGSKPANVTLYRPGECLPSGGLLIIR